jgi:hypothetical protein
VPLSAFTDNKPARGKKSTPCGDHRASIKYRMIGCASAL